MKKTLIPTLAVLLLSQSGFSAELCSGEQLKILEDQKFIEKFLDKYELGQCRSIEIYGKRSSSPTCIANIKIIEKQQRLDHQFPYEIIDCSHSE